jgi:ribonuclease T2
VLQYAPALCGASLKCPGLTPSWSYFTLHGLWPENSDGTYPQNCANAPFNPAAVSNITDELSKYWVSLAGPSETFWAHEWEKHGTCAAPVFPSEFLFMNGTLALRERYDITPALAAAGIVPSATATFTKAQFQAAVTKAFGFPVLPSCDASGNLNGATVCISKQGKAQSCGSVTYGTCSASTLRLVPPQ